MHLKPHEHPYTLIAPEESREFETQMASQYLILLKMTAGLPDLKSFSLDLCFYYFVDLMLAREGIDVGELSQEEYTYHVGRFKNHPDIQTYGNDMMTYFVLRRYTNEKDTHKGGSFSCIVHSVK